MIDFNIARKNMIHSQLKVNNITEDNILEAIDSVPRETFLPTYLKPRAYLDEDIQISSNRYLIEPMVLGYILKISEIQITDVVLDLACGSGYTTAVLSRLAKKVYGVDNNKLLLSQATTNLNLLNLHPNYKFLFLHQHRHFPWQDCLLDKDKLNLCFPIQDKDLKNRLNLMLS